MENLNNVLKDIFFAILNSGVKYIDKDGRKYYGLQYLINGCEVNIYPVVPTSNEKGSINNHYTTIDKISGGWNLLSNYNSEHSEDDIVFFMNVNTKHYFITDLTRFERARAIDLIEDTYKQLESRDLEKLSDELFGEEF